MILFLIFLVLCLLSFNWVMGYGKGNIAIDLDERYVNYAEYVKAIQYELVKQGREVNYKGDGIFIIDGRSYIFIERNVSMGGIPLQRTTLKPER
ncbi:MAG: hypothetical protein ACQEWU_07205 [Bacillota bacterium]|uniref:Uncharacterized protein n=1 Tax=Virgibacillus salarius TaxID=447199 RepID=A0A941DYL3_9BACI|nr:MULTISPECIES: hypothetical protein [Bacillaceae]MBR7798066.1 hypothetical protein [Virgibacillus salarius]MCC2250723.1 hypothetical protein [Virgibacillus sp. AGTR]NAZ10775.1 hypothetical protein [Agaribacter marinus]WBX79446.1 hypothetical protein PD280_17305 [Virgibacillus salarius]